MKTILLPALLLSAIFVHAQTDDSPILAPNLTDDFIQGSDGANAVFNEGNLGGNFVVRQGDGTLEIVESDFQGKKALKFSPTAETSTESSLLPCLVYRKMPESFPRGVTFQTRIKPDPGWGLSQSEIISARVSDRGTGLALTYRPNAKFMDVVSGSGGVDGDTWGIISDKRTNVFPGEWTHVAAVYDAENKHYRLYVNGQLAVESNAGLDLTTMDRTLTIGTYRGGYAYPFRGEMTDIAVFDYPRTEEQIRADADGK